MMNAAWPQAALCDLEATAFAEQHVGRGYPHVLKRHFAMAMRRVIVAKHIEWPNYRDPGRIGRHENHRLLRVLWSARVALAHHDVHRAAWVARAGNPPLATVDDVVVAVANDGGFDVGRIARRNCGFRHRKRRANFACEQARQPFGFFLGACVLNDGFHVSGIRRGAVEDFRRPWNAAHNFGQRRVFHVVEPCAVLVVRAKQIPQPLRFGDGL